MKADFSETAATDPYENVLSEPGIEAWRREMSKYLLYRSELKVIADALREYRKRHCGKDCMQPQNCLLYRSCEVILRDFDSSGDLIRNISFYDDEPTIIETMEDLGNEGELRWLKDSLSESAMA